LLKKNKKVTNA